MKTSKIIFISLVSIIAFFILAAIVDIRITGHRNGTNLVAFKVNKQSVPSFKVLYVNNSRSVFLVQNDSSFVEVKWLKDSLSPHVNYTIKDDTLIVSDINQLIQSPVSISVKIYSTDSLKNILLKNSTISIAHFRFGKMSLDMDKSSVWFNPVKSEKSSIHALDILAKNHSRVYTNEFKVDSLGIVLQKSEAHFEIIARKISGTLSDSSKISARQSEEISLKKDATSNINIIDN